MFRFTIREVLWVMVVVALCVAWWIERYDRDKEWKVVNTYTHQVRPAGEAKFYNVIVEHREKRSAPVP